MNASSRSGRRLSRTLSGEHRMSDLRFDNRVAVITGAGRGLGRAYALLLAAQGAKVVVNDLGGSLNGVGEDVGPAQGVVHEIKTAGGQSLGNTDTVVAEAGRQPHVKPEPDD